MASRPMPGSAQVEGSGAAEASKAKPLDVTAHLNP